MSKSLLLKLYLSFSTVFLASGCGDRTEIEEEGFVIVIGLDFPSDDKRGVEVTFQLAKPTSPATGGSGEFEGESVTIRAPDLLSARDLANASETRHLNFYHTKAIVISEDVARSKEFLNVAKAIFRERQLRRNMYLIISKEKAADFIRGFTPTLENRPHKFYDFMARRWERNALVPDSTFLNFWRDTEKDEGLPLAIYATSKKDEIKKKGNEDEYLPGQIDKKGGTEIQMIGAAVFKDGRMIEALNGEESRLTLLMRKEADPVEMIFTYVDPLDKEFRITLRAQNEETKVDVDTSTPMPKVNVDVYLKMELMAIPSAIDYVEDLEKQKLLKKHVEEQLGKKIQNVIDRSLKEFKGDPFLWSDQARRNFWTFPAFKNYNWQEKYPNADVNFKLHITLEDTGKLLAPPDLEDIKD